MKKLIFIIVVLIILILGYLLGNFLPLAGFFSTNVKSIKGDAKLEVRLVLENNTPLANVEVDVAEKTGPPSQDGALFTDKNGIATFYVIPGNYFIYFNTANFPDNYQVPKESQIAVPDTGGSKTIIIKNK